MKHKDEVDNILSVNEKLFSDVVVYCLTADPLPKYAWRGRTNEISSVEKPLIKEN